MTNLTLYIISHLKVKYKSFYLRSHALKIYAMVCFTSYTFAVNINQQEKSVLNKFGSIYFKIVVNLKLHKCRFQMDILVRGREGNGTLLKYSCLENPMDGGSWQAAVHGVIKSRTRQSDSTFTFTFIHSRVKWEPTPVFLPGESQGRGSLMGCRLWGRTELDINEVSQQQQQHLSEVLYIFMSKSAI